MIWELIILWVLVLLTAGTLGRIIARIKDGPAHGHSNINWHKGTITDPKTGEVIKWRK